MFRLYLIVLLSFTSMAFAARVADINVEPHFTNDGQTDFITVSVDTLLEQEKAVILRVKAFRIVAIEGDATGGMEALPTDGAAVRLRPGVQEKSGYQIVKNSFKISLAPWKLPEADEIKVGFVASIHPEDSEERIFEMPSPLQIIENKGGKKRVVLFPKAAPAEDSVLVDGKKILKDGTIVSLPKGVVAFPSREANSSISLERQAEEVAERAKTDPHALAVVRQDVVQPLAVDPNSVFFATNRDYKINATTRTKEFLTKLRGHTIDDISYGVVQVELPTRQQEQSYWSGKKAKMRKPELFNNEQQFMQEIANAKSRDVFMFIHGFCNTFEGAVVQAGRMKRDLQFPGNVMAFSWPSAGSLGSYDADAEFADDREVLNQFAHVLEKTVLRTIDAEGRVFLLAHSMGNRFLVWGLRKLYEKHGTKFAAMPKDKRPLAVVAFAAPDVDWTTFTGVVPNTVAMSNLVSLYYSTKDRALYLSETVKNKLDRAGLHPSFNDEMATINTDKLKTWFSMGHTYYGGSDRSILDLFLQFRFARLPAARVPPLEKDADHGRNSLFEQWFLTP